MASFQEVLRHLGEDAKLDDRIPMRNTGKNNGFPFLDVLGYLKNTHKNPKFRKVRQVPTRAFPPSSQIGTCLTLPNLGLLLVFFKYPKISKNGNLLSFPVKMVTRVTERYQLESGLQELTMTHDGSLPDFQNLRAVRRAWSSPHQLEADPFDFDEQAENYERFSCL